MNFDPTFDYGLSDLESEDNLICWKFGELIKTLITLSSSPDRQIEIIGAGIAIVTDEMALDFDTHFTLSHNHYLANNLLDEVTIDKLNDLNNYFDQRSGKKDPDFWDDTTLATNNDWQNVRMQAKEILTLMGCTKLDIEIERIEKYEESNEGKRLMSQTTRTRLISK